MAGESKHRKAIVTLIVGQRHAQLWQTLALPSWQRYAARHGYEIVALDRFPDESSFARERHLTWQKMLVLGHPAVARFERVLWLDSDIIINDAVAPCPVEQTPPERVGAVADQALLSHPALATPFARINHAQGGVAEVARAGYRVNGLEPPCDFWLNSGVLVLSPAIHRELFEEIYRGSKPLANVYDEQFPLTYELVRRGLYQPIDPRFNQLWLEYKAASYPLLRVAPALLSMCVATALDNSFFLHFAGRHQDLARFDPRVQVSADRFALPPDYIRGVAQEWGAFAALIERNSAQQENSPFAADTQKTPREPQG